MTKSDVDDRTALAIAVNGRCVSRFSHNRQAPTVQADSLRIALAGHL
jgi:hypothetical protein